MSRMLGKISIGGLRRKVILSLLLMVICLAFADDIGFGGEDITWTRLDDNVIVWESRSAPDEKSKFFQWLEDFFSVILPSSEELPFDESIAFLVGVWDYDNLKDLPFVENDINDLRLYLLEKGGFDKVYVATNEIATRDLVENYMMDIFRKTIDSDDRLLIYYAGHGSDLQGQTGYIQFSEARQNEFGRNVLPINRCIDWSAVIPAKHILFIFDCCASGLAFTPRGDEEDDYNRLLNAFSGNGSRTVITAGTGDEDTYEVVDDNGKANGIFTRAFLNAVDLGIGDSDKNGLITIREIMAHVESDIKNFAIRYKKQITPNDWPLQENQFSGTFVFPGLRNPKAALPSSFIEILHAEPRGEEGFDKVRFSAVTAETEWDLLLDKGLAQRSAETDSARILMQSADMFAGNGNNNEAMVAYRSAEKIFRVLIEENRRQRRDLHMDKILRKPGERAVIILNDMEFAFRWIPPGKCLIGSPEDERPRGLDERQWEATFSKGFWMGETEVTQEQWATIMADHILYGHLTAIHDGCEKCPMENITYKHVDAFLYVINNMNTRFGCRLPTEAEWEYACRAGTELVFGIECPDDLSKYVNPPCLDDIGWYDNNSDSSTHAVKLRRANYWGLYDMVGNVFEMCQDTYESYPVEPRTDYANIMTGGKKVRRGGSWYNDAFFGRCAARHKNEANATFTNVGFRIVMENIPEQFMKR